MLSVTVASIETEQGEGKRRLNRGRLASSGNKIAEGLNNVVGGGGWLSVTSDRYNIKDDVDDPDDVDR